MRRTKMVERERSAFRPEILSVQLATLCRCRKRSQTYGIGFWTLIPPPGAPKELILWLVVRWSRWSESW